jgi:hypothetical protein
MSDDRELNEVDKYLAAVKAYGGEFKPWQGRVEKILKRYRDDSRKGSETSQAKFNILWSNVQTLLPAVYAKMPKADVSRRFSDNDPVGRVAALLIERALDYEIEHYPHFRSGMKNAVEDRFLGGRGVLWVRYDPHIKAQDDGLQLTEDHLESEPEAQPASAPAAGAAGGPQPDALPGEGDTANMTGGQEGAAAPEEIDYECAPSDYVHWKDFGHTPARTWEEVGMVWRWVYLSREALDERFGEEIAKKVPINTSPETLSKVGQATRMNDKAKVCELWDKDAGEAVWFHEDVPELLDRKADPLELEGFFPCGKPLYATTTSDSLVPVPDFTLYQDQARELDILSDRIDGLVKALRVRGVYDASIPELQRLLTEGDNNTLIPADKWMAFSEKGGLKGAIDLLPIDMIAAALMEAYKARADIKNQIYEITGISDIVRGQGQASETATAQRIKGQYAGLRLQSMQDTVAMFATETLRIMAQIICSKYQPDTILAYAAAAQLSPEDQQLIPQALALLKNKPLRTFRVEVASDSMVEIDQDQEKKDRSEFITAIATFLKEAVPATQQAPELLPVMMAALKYLVAGYKAGRVMEGVIDLATQKLEQSAAQAAGQPKPDPEAIKAQAAAAQAAAKLNSERQTEAARLEADKAKWAADATIAKQKLDYEYKLKQADASRQRDLEWRKAELNAATQIMVARISANPGVDLPVLHASDAAAEAIRRDFSEGVGQVLSGLAEHGERLTELHSQALDRLNHAVQAIGAPKRLVRGPDGRATGVETIAA